MPVGTQATVKGVLPEQVKELGAEIILANTYHLALRPGSDLIKQAGGLHKFMGWSGPILTDSGGFQVFSLASNTLVSDDGVCFKSHIDGSAFELTPEKAVRLQEDFGSDIIMPLDICSPWPTEEADAKKDMLRTIDWAEKSLKAWSSRETSALFAIVQGSVFKNLRQYCAKTMGEMNFSGYAVGGVSVGEGNELMRTTVEMTTPSLPWDKPRYAMGVGDPEGIFDCVENGIDMFDSVMPTRNARTGRIFTRDGHINILNSRFKDDFTPLDSECNCVACQKYTRAYVHHLFKAKEMLASQLATLHNLHFWQDMMKGIRESIESSLFSEFKKDFLDRFGRKDLE